MIRPIIRCQPLWYHLKDKYHFQINNLAGKQIDECACVCMCVILLTKWSFYGTFQEMVGLR